MTQGRITEMSPSEDSAVEAKDLEPDSLQWTFVSKAVWVKGILCSTPWHTAASMVRFWFFAGRILNLFLLWGGRLQGQQQIWIGVPYVKFTKIPLKVKKISHSISEMRITVETWVINIAKELIALILFEVCFMLAILWSFYVWVKMISMLQIISKD